MDQHDCLAWQQTVRVAMEIPLISAMNEYQAMILLIMVSLVQESVEMA